jgi:hypothetical protein
MKDAAHVNVNSICQRRHNSLSVVTTIQRHLVVMVSLEDGEQEFFKQAADLVGCCCIPDCDGRLFQICGAATRKARAAVAVFVDGIVG